MSPFLEGGTRVSLSRGGVGSPRSRGSITLCWRRRERVGLPCMGEGKGSPCLMEGKVTLWLMDPLIHCGQTNL